MNMWMRDLAQVAPTAQESFESSVSALARLELEKSAGEFSEYLDGLLEQKSATPHLDKFKQQTKLAQRMGRELAHREAMDKEAGIASQALSALKPMASKALGWAAKNPTAAMGVGGAALGAATAAPGHRMTGALTGGAIGYGAGRLGQGGVQNLANKGMQQLNKLAGIGTMLSSNVGRAGLGAAAGAAMGALHKSQGERMGVAPGHHLRNALMGAAGGAALGAGSRQIGKALVGAEHAAGQAVTHVPTGGTLAHAAPHVPAGPTHVPTGNTVAPQAASPQGWGSKPVKGVPMEQQIADYRARGNKPPSETFIARNAPAAVGASPSSNDRTNAVGRKRPPVSNPALAPTMGGMPKMAGAAFLKMAWATKVAGPPPIPGAAMGAAAKVLRRPPPIPAAASGGLGAALKTLTPHGMSVLQQVPKFASIQAEPGTPGGAQEPEAEAQFQSRPVSKPAAELYSALKHLSPKTMQGLQAAQPGT